MSTSLVLGAPGIYRAPERVDRSYAGVRLDVAGFVGVAPRGPVGQAVRVENWSEYQRRFGRFEGPGRLPHAVRVFFEQGGDRAWVVRVGPDPSAGEGDLVASATAVYDLPGLRIGPDAPPARLAAADEGAWGNGLRIELGFDIALQFRLPVPGGGPEPTWAGGRELPIPEGVYLPLGSLLRMQPAGRRAEEFRWVEDIVERDEGSRGRQRFALLDCEPAAPSDAAVGRTTVALVEGRLSIDDTDTGFPRAELHAGLGLSAGHPRWLPDAIAEASILVAAVEPWPSTVEPATALLPPVTAPPGVGGRDRYDEIGEADFVDRRWDPLGERETYGVHELLGVEELGLLVVPDLGWGTPTPAADPEPDPEPPRRPVFGPCPPKRPPLQPRRPAVPIHSLVDASTQEGFETWVERQRQVVDLADLAQRFVALLDVPPGLPPARVSQWRALFDSSYAAAYHPWLLVADDEAIDSRAERVPPSAFAAGIIADRERRLGLPWGPANELARGAVALVDPLTAAEHDALHPLGINVFTATRDGMQLSSARTLSRRPPYRQLTVRRLLTMLRLTIERDSQWMVFEPNNEHLWATVRFHLVTFLRQLFTLGAFAGATESESFFVRCDAQLNSRQSLDLGRLLVEVGVAPAEPLEFVVLRVERKGDGDVRVEERNV